MFLRIATVALVCFGLVAAQECGGSFNIPSGGSVDVTSPGYPSQYSNNINCLYTITAEASDSFVAIEVNSNAFDTESNYDAVEFFEADGSSAGKFSGSSAGPSKHRLSSNVITMRFKTDGSVTRTGFSLRFSHAKCRKGQGNCPNHPDVCLSSNAWCNGEQDCPDGIDEDCPDPGSCGKSAVKPSGRIVGGSEAVPHSHPWQAAMLSSGGSQICGGTVIDPQWIMTAAHCCAAYSPSPSNYKFRIGAHAYATSEDGASTVTLSKIVMHPSYNSPVRYAHDFCLVKTNERMQFTRNVQPACIPTGPVAEGETVTVTGWGNTLANRGDFEDFIRLVKDVEEGRIPKGVADDLIKASSTLRQVDVKVSNQEYCNRQYSNGISADMICAAAPGKDSCQGDSGGPLVHSKDGQAFLHGVVSWGRGCAQANYPGVYARTSEVLPWILETIRSG